MAIYVRTTTFARNIFHPIIPINGNNRIQTFYEGPARRKSRNHDEILSWAVYQQSTGTEIFIIPSFFEYYIDRAKSEKAGIRIPAKTETATLEEADKFGFILRSSGTLIVSNRRLRTPDVVYHEKANEKLEALTKVVLESFNAVGADAVGNGWLKNVVDRYLHPEKYEEAKVGKDFFDYGRISLVVILVCRIVGGARSSPSRFSAARTPGRQTPNMRRRHEHVRKMVNAVVSISLDGTGGQGELGSTRSVP